MEQFDFYKGVDISFLPRYMEEGMQVRDFDGTAADPFFLLKKYGVNSVRLRIWKNPDNVPESGGYCSLVHTLAMAKKIKEWGMHFLLDFHYSDYWADPANQRKPKEWEHLSFEGLEQAVFDYTREVLLALKNEGVMPDMVQIGNEIRNGLLFPDGERPDYPHMVSLINAGIRGARSVAEKEEMQVMIHLEEGGRYFYLKDWFENTRSRGLDDFDVIGLSYYPFWHGTFSDVKETMKRLTEDYHKPIAIVETAHAWRISPNGFIDRVQERIAGFEASPEGQVRVLNLVMNIVASLPDQMGRGVYYWEPLCWSLAGEGGWGENMGLLDESGRVMEGIKAFRFERKDFRGKECAKVYEPKPISVQPGQEPELPEFLPVLCFDGSIERKKVDWEAFPDPLRKGREGKYTLSGNVEGRQEAAELVITVTAGEKETENLLYDTNWEEGLAQWSVTSDRERVIAQIVPEYRKPLTPPFNMLRVEGIKKFTFIVSQTISVSPGNYCVSVEFMGIDNTNVDIRLFAQSKKEKKEIHIHPTQYEWMTYEIEGIRCEEETLTIGISIQAPPIWGMMRNFRLTKSGMGKESYEKRF